MRRAWLNLLALWVAVAVCGCGFVPQPSPPAAQPVRAEDLVGKWRLVRAGGQPPTAMQIKALQIDLAADGTWVSEVEMEGQFAGMTLKGGGKWSVAEGVVRYTSGANAGESHARVESGRLFLDPDFTVRIDGTREVIGEYQR